MSELVSIPSLMTGLCLGGVLAILYFRTMNSPPPTAETTPSSSMTVTEKLLKDVLLEMAITDNQELKNKYQMLWANYFMYSLRNKGKNNSIDESIDRVLKEMKDTYKKELEDYPSPNYCGYEDLEVGGAYYIAGGLSHDTFIIHEKENTENGIVYTYTIAKLENDKEDIEPSFYTTKRKLNRDLYYTRFKKGTWLDEKIIPVL